MTSKTFEPRTAQIRLSGGAAQPAGELIAVVEPASLFAPEARKGRLYILLAPEGGEAARSAALVTKVLRREFYADASTSVTAALRGALRAANKALHEHNVAHPTHQRVAMGVTCVVVKDSDIYIAQVLPGQVFVQSQGRLRAIPVPPSWGAAHTSAAVFSPGKGLGASLFIEPEFYRMSLAVGDGALIVGGGLAAGMGRAEAEAILAAGDADAILAALAARAAAAGAGDGHALAIACAARLSPSARAAPLSPAGIGQRGRLAVASVGDWLAQITGEVALAARGRPRRQEPRPREAAADPLTTMPEEPPFTTSPAPRPKPIDMGEGLQERYDRQRAELPPSMFLGEGEYVPAPAPTRRIDLMDHPVSRPRPYRPRFEQRPVVDMSIGERLLLPVRLLSVALNERASRRYLRRREPPRAPVRVQGLSYRRQRGPTIPWLLFTVLALVVTLLIFYGTTLSQQNADERALDYLVVAEQRMAEVRQAGDDDEALERLEVARQAIDEVRASPNVTVTNTTLWLRYQDLQREYERALAAVQRLTFFGDLTLLASHPLPTGLFASVSVPPATSGITDPRVIDNLRYIYALDSDTQNARLYRVPRDGGATEVYLAPGQQAQATVVGPLRAQTWRTDQVVALDQGPGGFGYYFRIGDGWGYTKLGDSEIWRSRQRLDVETYDGNLYIWGAEPNEILKYNSGFYGDAPQFWIDATSLEGRDLSTVVDMAVDGNIYLLQSDGAVLVFTAGRLVSELKPEGLTPPVTAVTAFVVTGPIQEGFIFILDTLNERIIQMDKVTGAVIQQIKARPDDAVRLDRLASLWVDASGTRPNLYLVNGGTILKAALPAPPRPLRQDGPEATPTP